MGAQCSASTVDGEFDEVGQCRRSSFGCCSGQDTKFDAVDSIASSHAPDNEVDVESVACLQARALPAAGDPDMAKFAGQMPLIAEVPSSEDEADDDRILWRPERTVWEEVDQQQQILDPAARSTTTAESELALDTALQAEVERDDAFAHLRAGKPMYLLPEHMRADREIVLAAIAVEGSFCYDYIARELREEDRDVVFALVLADGSLLEAASEPLRNDRQIVRAALRTYSGALKLASPQLQGDKELRAVATAQAKDEKRLLQQFAEKACGPSVRSCFPR